MARLTREGTTHAISTRGHKSMLRLFYHYKHFSPQDIRTREHALDLSNLRYLLHTVALLIVNDRFVVDVMRRKIDKCTPILSPFYMFYSACLPPSDLTRECVCAKPPQAVAQERNRDFGHPLK